MKPILFNTEMVQAIMPGWKTVTRRAVKFKPGQNPFWSGYIPDGSVLYGSNNIPAAKAPFSPGDILYVRETWRVRDVYGDLARGDRTAEIEYRAGGATFKVRASEDVLALPGWNPSIHMPKIFSRIFLRVKSVRVERLQDIDEDGATKEGCASGVNDIAGGPWGVEDDLDEWTAREAFAELWDITIKPSDLNKYGWAANPWVWVIEFERCEKPEVE